MAAHAACASAWRSQRFSLRVFRANELRSLTPGSFDLDADPPTVAVEAAYLKHRRKDVQPIRQDLADLLRPWLAERPAGEAVFGTMPEKTARMMKQDLEAAKRKWAREVKLPAARKERVDSSFLAYRNSADLVADFHALRHTYVSRLVKSGANIKVAQELARHSTPILTLGRYAHVEIVGQTKALAALPSIDTGRGGREAARATGTDDEAVSEEDEPPARSALSARQRPGTPSPVLTCQEGRLDNWGLETVESSRVVATGHNLSLPNNISSHLSSTVEHRFRKAVPNPRKPREIQDLDPTPTDLSAPVQRADKEGRWRCVSLGTAYCASQEVGRFLWQATSVPETGLADLLGRSALPVDTP